MNPQPSSIELVADKEQKLMPLVFSNAVSWLFNVGIIWYLATSGRSLFPSDTVLYLVGAGLVAVQLFGTWAMFRSFHNRIIRLTMDRQSVFIVKQRDLGVGASGSHLAIDPTAPMNVTILPGKGKHDLYITYQDPSGAKQRLYLDGFAFSRDSLLRLKNWIDSRSAAST